MSIFFSGCMFIGLSEDVEKLEAATSITGKIELANNSHLPIVVTLSRSEGGENPLQSYTVVYDSNDFFFSVPKGKYYLLAFEDSNHDFTLQDNERVGWYGSPTLIDTDSKKTYTNISITLREPTDAKIILPSLYTPEMVHKPVNIDKINLGKVVDTSVFKPELGSLGMWEPVKFHLEGHSGIYFLEPYNKKKIPVLLVHGISGSGHDWLYVLENLDREKFQPWVVQYPSGMRLSLLSKSLSQSINELKATYNFTELAVVAHSMGGLISRGLINHQSVSDEKSNSINTFITISTPWLGHNAASQGAKYAPVAVPSWFDMVPESPYLNSLYKQALPKNIQFHLLFSHKGKGGGIIKKANSDGTVTLASQLPNKAQEEAVKVIGYDETHIGILNSVEVIKKINKILKKAY
ncbi:alpha/beta fold hydrolase [Eionea flava]